MLKKQLPSIDHARLVSKRVAFGELVSFLRKETTDQLTLGVERSAAGRFAFLANCGKGWRRFAVTRRALCFEREVPDPGISRQDSRVLCLIGGLALTTWWGSG